MSSVPRNRRILGLSAMVLAAFCGGAGNALLGVCGPFTDVAADAFCPFVLEIFYLGITTGTSPTTYDPASPVTRLQMAAFLSRTVDGVLKRGSRRAAMSQFWTSQNSSVLGVTTLPATGGLFLLQSDGADLWVVDQGGVVFRVRGSDGKRLETWTGATQAVAVLPAMGRILVTGGSSPGRLYSIDPAQPAGAVTTVASNLGNGPQGIAFDGARFFTANGFGSVSIVTPGAAIPWTATTVTAGFTNPNGAVYDGSNVWIAEYNTGKLLKLSSAAAILQTVTVGPAPAFPLFDGANIWVPNSAGDSISVVRPSNGAILQTLTGNGLNVPWAAAFDGQRVLVTNQTGESVSLWKAADLTPLGVFQTGPSSFPTGACSDGIHFWITLAGPETLARF